MVTKIRSATGKSTETTREKGQSLLKKEMTAKKSGGRTSAIISLFGRRQSQGKIETI